MKVPNKKTVSVESLDLFDISHAIAPDLIKIKEAFIKHRKKDRPGH